MSIAAHSLPFERIPGPGAASSPVRYWRVLRFFTDLLVNIRQQYQQYGAFSSVVGDAPPGLGMVCALGPVYNQQVLSDPAHFYSPEALEGQEESAIGRLCSGVLFQNGERHKQQRRLVMPVFHKKYIENYHSVMVHYGQHMLERWETGGTRDMAHEMHLLSLQIANKALFGLETRDGESIGDLIGRWFNYFSDPIIRIFPRDFPGSPVRRWLHASERLEGELLAMIAEKRRQPESGSDVMSLLLQTHDEDGVKLTDAELIGQINILFLAGHETTATALGWGLLLLSQHPDVLHKLLDEIEGLLHGGAPTIEQLGQMPLLEAVINETLRLLPPASFTQRTATEDCEIGGYFVPKGSLVMLSHYMTHHMEDVFDHPDEFRPERWERINPSAYEYIPFSAGPRMCIGAQMAMMEMKTLLPMMLQRYRIEPAPGATIGYRDMPTLIPRPGIPMNIYPQDRQFRIQPVRGKIHQLVDLPLA